MTDENIVDHIRNYSRIKWIVLSYLPVVIFKLGQMIGFLIFGVTLIVKLNVDYWQYLKGKKINHSLEAVFVTILLVGASYFSGWWAIPMFFFGFTCLFDPAFALLMGQKPFYLGTTAKLDILQRKYPFLQWLKYILFIGSIILYIYAN